MRLHTILMPMGEHITWLMDLRITNNFRKPAFRTTSYENTIPDGLSIEQAVTVRSN